MTKLTEEQEQLIYADPLEVNLILEYGSPGGEGKVSTVANSRKYIDAGLATSTPFGNGYNSWVRLWCTQTLLDAESLVQTAEALQRS